MFSIPLPKIKIPRYMGWLFVDLQNCFSTWTAIITASFAIWNENSSKNQPRIHRFYHTNEQIPFRIILDNSLYKSISVENNGNMMEIEKESVFFPQKHSFLLLLSELFIILLIESNNEGSSSIGITINQQIII